MVFHDLYEPWHGLIISGKHAVLAKVRHSQKMNDPTVPPWIITEDDGRILCAHCCECMAGQGETCSHIASVVFYIETFNRIRILGSSSWLLKIPNVNLTHFWDDMLMSDLCNREDWWSSGWMEVGGVLKLCKMFY